MRLNKFSKKLLVLSQLTIIPLVASSCVTKEEKRLEEYFKSEIKDISTSEIVNGNLNFKINKSYEKEINKFDKDYKSIEKKALFYKTIDQYNKSKTLTLEEIYSKYKNYKLNPDHDDLKSIESSSMSDLIKKYISNKRSDEVNWINELKYIQDVNGLYYDAFDTSLTYLIDKYTPDNFYVYDIYNYINQLLKDHNKNYFINQEKDNLFNIYINKNIKSMIEIPVKMINFNRDNFINELVIAYNQESQHWDTTNYEDVNIKKIINNRNIEIDPIKQNVNMYKNYVYDKYDHEQKWINIQNTNNIDKYIESFQQSYSSTQNFVSYKNIRNEVINPYYTYHINNLMKELKGVEGFQISYYGTKIRLYLDHEVNDEDIQKIKNWTIFDEYIPEELNVNWLYELDLDFSKKINENLRNREIYYVNNFNNYKDFVLGTRIFVDMREKNNNDVSYQYMNIGSSPTTNYIKYDKYSSHADFLKNKLYNLKNIDNLSKEFQNFVTKNPDFDKTEQLYILKNIIKTTGKISPLIDKDYQKLSLLNIYPSLTVAQPFNTFFEGKNLNYSNFADYDSSKYFHNLSTSYDESAKYKYLNIEFTRNNSWDYSKANYSILPEKTFLNNKSTIFKQLLKNNYEYKYNLDWKTVSYSFIPYDLEDYEGYNQNYNNLLNYLQNSLKNNNIELARIGIDQLSVR